MEQGVQTFGSDQLLQLKTVGHINTEKFETEGVEVFYSVVNVVLFNI